MLDSLRARVDRVVRDVPVPREDQFSSRLHSPAVAARVGIWLGICFALAFVTGWLSHEAQDPGTWVPFPTRPTWLYQVTQGVHVFAGTAAIPLLLVKLWTVYPRLFAAPPRHLRRLLVVLLERGSVGVLVASAIFQVATGLMNAAQWYPWDFHFRATHFAVAWIALGSLAIHVAVKVPVIRRVLGEDIDADQIDDGSTVGRSPLSRRALVRTSLLAAGTAVVATAGSTVPMLRQVSVFGVRTGDGPQGVPVNKSARAAGVLDSAGATSYRLVVAHRGAVTEFSRRDLERLPQQTHTLPIACVEGWSASGDWTGVLLRDLLDLAGAPVGRAVRVESLQPHGAYRSTYLPSQFADDSRTLLALELNDAPLTIDHGYPCRLIAPNRPGVLQTKWLSRLEVL